MSTRPSKAGWYWFLPDENCPVPKGFEWSGDPMVVHVRVGFSSLGPDHNPPRLFAMFRRGPLWVSDLIGDWEPTEVPERMMAELDRRREVDAGGSSY